VGSAIVVIFAGYFASFVWKIGHTPEIIVQNTVQSEQNLTDDTNEDTDGDGLKNWEEILWKTNPDEDDSDDDGMSDGEEITEGRDPTIKRALLAGGAWSDTFKKPEEVLAQNPSSDAPKTMTEKLARDFVTSYFATKSAAGGEDLNAPTKDALINALSHTVDEGTAAYRDVYVKKDVRISEKADSKTYLNHLGSMFAVNFKEIEGMEVQMVVSIAQSGNFAELYKIDAYLAAYKKTVAFLLNELVPPAYVELHLMILNSMNTTGLAVEDLKLIEKDPARSLIGVQLYYREISRAGQFLRDLKIQTDTDKISFSESDGGYFFNKYFEKI